MVHERLFLIGTGNPRRLIRLGLILLALWIGLEVLLAKLIANRFGWGTTILLHVLKGGFGLILLGWLTATSFRRLRAHLGGHAPRASIFARIGYPIASAILITLPGLLPALAGIALFSPSLRRAINTRFVGARRQDGPPEIDLATDEWQETRKPRKPRRALPRKPPLEGEPPKV